MPQDVYLDNGVLIDDKGAPVNVAALRSAADAAAVPSLHPTINSQTGTTYTLALTDDGKVVECNNASAITLTVPPNSSVAFSLGTLIEVYQQGAGQVTITAGAGVTLRIPNGAKTAKQYSTVGLRKRDTDTWVVSGDTTS